MRRVLLLIIAVVAVPVAAAAQDSARATAPAPSTARGLFIGGAVERDTFLLPPDSEPSDAKSGPGFGVAVGYGFTERLSLFGEVGTADLGTVGVNTEASLAHYDGGVRVRVLAGRKRIVPFVQAGVSVPVLKVDLILGPSSELSADSYGIAAVFGGGVHAHLRPSLAITATASFSAARYSRFIHGGERVPGDAFRARGTRVGVGMTWFLSGGR